MKRFWQGAALLLALLLLGIGTAVTMETLHSRETADLTQAAAAAQAGDWTLASQKLNQSRQQWEAGWTLTAAVCDHGPMEQIDSLYAMLDIMVKNHAPEFAGYCAQLALLTQAIGEAHQFNLRNIL